LLFIR
ncbi:hypothetical protein D039_3779B, partial [Vibrio parahaemolyticus EKP-028]